MQVGARTAAMLHCTLRYALCTGSYRHLESCTLKAVQQQVKLTALPKSGTGGDVEKTLDKQDSKSSQSERPGILGGLAQRLQEGVRATIVALGQSHAQRLAALVESSDDAILSVDLGATIATWNRGAEELFGYAPEEVVGKSVTILIPADRQDEEPKILERVGRGEHVQHYETVRLRKDGRCFPVSLSVSPIIDASGTIIGACKIARDVTERKRAEEAQAKRVDEQTALYEFTDRLFRAGSVVDIYEAALDSIVRALGCERASILLFRRTPRMSPGR